MKTHYKLAGVKLATSAALFSCVFYSGISNAALAVAINDFDGGLGANQLALGGTLTASGFAGNPGSYSSNPALSNSSWAHTGDFWTFQVMADSTTTVRVNSADPLQFTPGLTVWASGSTAFDGGTTGFGAETSSAGFGTPHSFNSTGVMGDLGTKWMASGYGGNMIETLGYANAGASIHAGGWNEAILNGGHDVSLTNNFESGIIGSVGAGFSQLELKNLKAGYYTIFVGGTNIAQSGGQFNVTVSSVPIPAAAWLFGSSLLGLAGSARRKYKIA